MNSYGKGVAVTDLIQEPLVCTAFFNLCVLHEALFNDFNLVDKAKPRDRLRRYKLTHATNMPANLGFTFRIMQTGEFNAVGVYQTFVLGCSKKFVLINQAFDANHVFISFLTHIVRGSVRGWKEEKKSG